MLDFVEETLDQVALLLNMVIVFALFFPVLAEWIDGFSFFVCNQLQEMVRIVRTILNYPFKLKCCNQVFGLGDIVPLPAGQKKA